MVLRAYPDGSMEAQALARDLLDAITVGGFPLLPPRPLRYIKAPACYDGKATSLFLAAASPDAPTGRCAPCFSWM
ncbi:hypothetical protein ABZX95_20545 [Streptomyces sp. NPDC004232]|uniref:hypothetical protein n=1 Tax=unclassified Streptomyces TaxID=2593676 RepID=UPI001D3471E6|nr:hypothetical protein [Streptomyces sp. tea 10]